MNGKDIIVTVDFFDMGDLASKINRLAFGHGACHVGLCVGEEYLYPQAKGRMKVRPSTVIYHNWTPIQSITLLGNETNPRWIDSYEGRTIDSTLWRLITEPIYVLKDTGLCVNVPKRIICVDIIADALRDLGVPVSARTPNGFYRELLNHTHRIG